MNILRTRALLPIRTARRAALPAYGVWMRLGFVGMSFVAGGLVELQSGNASLFTALAYLLAGGALAALSWHGAVVALKDMDAASEVRAAVPAAIDGPRALPLSAKTAEA
jgi:hypothetical protein